MHTNIVIAIANNLNAEKKGLALCKKLGTELAEEAVKDELSMNGAVDGIMFLKQAIWLALDTEDLLKDMTSHEFYELSMKMGTLCDVVASNIAFCFHYYQTLKVQQLEIDLSLILNNIKDYDLSSRSAPKFQDVIVPFLSKRIIP